MSEQQVIPILSLDQMADAADSLLPALDKMKKHKWAGDYFDKHELKAIRELGPYVWIDDKTSGEIGSVNMSTGLPSWVCVAINDDNEFVDGEKIKNQFRWRLVTLTRLTKFPVHVIWVGDGYAYEVTLNFYDDKHGGGWSALQYFVSIDKDGTITPCRYRMKGQKSWRGTKDWVSVPTLELGCYGDLFNNWFDHAKDDGIGLCGFLGVVIDAWKHREYCWNAIFLANKSRITFGFDVYEAKRIFAERVERKTPSGRKKPIIHWVKSHQRKKRAKTLWQRFLFFVLKIQLYTKPPKTHIRGSHDFFVRNWRVAIRQDGEGMWVDDSLVRLDVDGEYKTLKKAVKGSVYHVG
jgi:hypothetical protein